MNSRDQAHAENERALRDLLMRPIVTVVLIVAIAVLGVVVASGAAYNIATRHATDQISDLTDRLAVAVDEVRIQAKAQCDQNKAVANAPVPSTANELGLAISVGARIGYSTAKCTLGDLNPPDPRVAKLLPPGVR